MDRLSAPGTSRAAHPVHHSAPSRRTTPMPITVKALQKTGPDQPFRVATIERRDPRPDDVGTDISAAGPPASRAPRAPFSPAPEARPHADHRQGPAEDRTGSAVPGRDHRAARSPAR